MTDYRAVTMTIDEDLLAEIDARANSMLLRRSALVRLLLVKALGGDPRV